jgi:hypothetical protein
MTSTHYTSNYPVNCNLMNTNKHLIISGVLFTVVLFLWPVFMGLSEPQGTVSEQLEWIGHHTLIYKIQFFFAWLISPSIIYLMFSQLDKYPSDDKPSTKTGMVLLAGYFVLNSIAYGSQMVLLPGLIQNGLNEQAQLWYFGSKVSIPYFLNQMGYGFWAFAALILFARLPGKRGIIKYISLVYLLSAVLSVVAFAGLVAGNRAINSLTLYSGLTLAPVGILTLILGVREKHKETVTHGP